MKPADLVIAAFPGASVTKARPAVVLSTEEYHRRRPDVVLGLITTREPKPPAPSDCQLDPWKQSGLHAPSFFRLYLVTLPQTDVRVIGRFRESDWGRVLACVRAGPACN